jgi:DNA mismatch endonuclease (patch repair protein)
VLGGLTRSETMARIRSRGTLPEIKLRKALWSDGLRYRLAYDLPGRPDLTFVDARLAIFVDGCFWHGCPTHYSAPRTNRNHWARKLRCNVERDLATDDALQRLGWYPFHVWQHELSELGELVGRIRFLLSEAPLRGGRDSAFGACNPIDRVGNALVTSSRAEDTLWYQCACGCHDVRVLAVSNPGSLRPNAKKHPFETTLVCVCCRHIFMRRQDSPVEPRWS